MLLSSIADQNDRLNEYNETKAALVKLRDKTSEVAVDQLKVKINDIVFQSSAMLDGISPLQKRIFLSRERLAGYFTLKWILTLPLVRIRSLTEC